MDAIQTAQSCQDVFEGFGFSQDLQELMEQSFRMILVESRQFLDVFCHWGMSGHKHSRLHIPYPVQRLKISLDIIHKGDAILFQRFPGAQAVSQKDHIICGPKSLHLEKMSGQIDHLQIFRQDIRRQFPAVTGLGHEILVPQCLERIPTIKKGRLQHRPFRKGAFDAWRIDPAAGAVLKKSAATDVIRVGMGNVNGLQLPVIPVQHLAYFSSRFLVAAGIDQHDPCIIQLIQTHSGRRLNGPGPSFYMLEFIHALSFSSFSFPVHLCFCVASVSHGTG